MLTHAAARACARLHGGLPRNRRAGRAAGTQEGTGNKGKASLAVAAQERAAQLCQHTVGLDKNSAQRGLSGLSAKSVVTASAQTNCE